MTVVHKKQARPARAKRQYRVIGRVCTYFEAVVHASSKGKAIARVNELYHAAELEAEEQQEEIEIETVEPLE